MPEDNRTRDTGVADLDDGNSILILKSELDLLLLGLNGNQCVFSKIIDFKSEGLPTGMGAMMLGNNRFFMFGGRKFSGRKFGETYGSDTFRKAAYKLVHDNDDWSLKLTEEVKELSAHKFLPHVEEVDGNIFVIQNNFAFCTWENPHPLLEAYDTKFNTWKDFRTIKNWSNEEEAVLNGGWIRAHFSVGCRIYIKMHDRKSKRDYYFCFNTSKYEWEEENAKNLGNSLKNCRVQLPFEAVCVSGVQNSEVNLNVVLYKKCNTVLAVLIDDSGYFVCYQNLTHELYKNREKVKYCFGESLIKHESGGGRMCLVTKFPEKGKKDGFVILLRDFELKVIEGFKKEVQELASGMSREMKFLTVHIYNNRRFNIIDPYGGQFGLCDAFFLSRK